MRVAPEVKLILAFADAKLGLAGRIGAGVKGPEPDFDAVERLGGLLLFDFDGELVLGLAVDRDAEPRGDSVVTQGPAMNRTA